MTPELHLAEDNLLEYLRNSGQLGAGEEARIEPVGDGNINWVRRVRAGERSLVVKQARPALERFPEYQASTERLLQEARFYEVVAEIDADAVCPRVLWLDEAARVLVLEDLGDCERLDAALARGADVGAAAATLARFLARVHGHTRDPALARRFANHEMRALHGAHIYRLPFEDNDFPLSAAVRARAASLRDDAALLARIAALEARYFGDGECLIHGDVQPANVLLAASGPKLLDAEIAHFGDPAFDVGQLLGHLLLPRAAAGDAPHATPLLRDSWRAYREAATSPPPLEHVAGHAGVELLRRALGAARVPAVAEDAASLRVVDCGVALLRDGLALD